MTEDKPIRELRLALDGYMAGLKVWREYVDTLNEEYKTIRRDSVAADPHNEADLYRYARVIVGASYAGDLPSGETLAKYRTAARRYILGVKRLTHALEGADDHLTEVSGGEGGLPEG